MMESRLAKLLNVSQDDVVPKKFKYSEVAKKNRKLEGLFSLDTKTKDPKPKL